MPVSRGGGYSGGGSSGSFSSSGSSQSTHFSKKEFPGATRYVFINRYGHSSYFYSNTEPKPKKIGEIFAMMAIWIVAACVICAMLIASSFPQKMSADYCDAKGVYYHDDAGIVLSETTFNQYMQGFYEKTGVEPYLYAITEASFPSKVYGALDKNSLEEFAYDTYLDLYEDEGHYMIFYVRASDGTELWLEMAGTDTTSLLDDTVYESFQNNMQRKLYNSEDKSLAIAECLLIMADEAFIRTSGDIFTFVLGIIIAVAAAVAITFITIAQIKQAKEINDYCNFVANGNGELNSDAPSSEATDEKINFKDYI